MPSTCVVFNCTNRYDAAIDRSFHGFPFSDPDRCQKWINNISRMQSDGKPWVPSKHSRVCSDHFLPSNFKSETKIGELKNTAVPTVFPTHPDHKQPKSTPRRSSPKKRFFEATPSTSKATECDESASKYIRLTEHSYALPNIETELEIKKRELKKMGEKLAEKNKEIKVLNQKLKRRDVKIAKLLTNMEHEKILSHEQHDLLTSSFDSKTLTLIENELSSTQKASLSGMRYSDDLKKFAVTLHFYSSQAYNYVRQFLSLPHPSTIQKWAYARHCNPGFITEVFDTLKQNVTEETKDVAVMFDGMHVKKAYTYDNGAKRYFGSVNLGHLTIGEDDTLAGQSLTVMVVGLKKHFKMPIGYFLIDKITADTQAQIVRDALSLLNDAGYTVHSVVCDGNYTNQSTAIALGCNLDPVNTKCWFNHPTTEEQVFFVFDACHLIKNIRNCLGDLRVLQVDGKEIKWDYIVQLDNIQKTDNLVLANKLRGKHINFEQNKMNVKFAVQTISSSVANAIDFLRNDLGLSQFAGSAETTNFIRTFDMLFDICNSSTPFGKGLKSPIRQENISKKEASVEEAISYILELKEKNGRQITSGRRKTGFVGFICTLRSIIGLSKRLLNCLEYRYFMTYRLSQDHLETFFSRIRRRNGWNNNPTPAQFKWALRSLLLKNGVLPSSRSNCIELEEPSNRLVQTDNAAVPKSKSETVMEEFIKILRKPSVYHENVLFYISGFVARKVGQVVQCAKCMQVLYQQDYTNSPASSFTKRCNRGGLIMSNDMYIVIKAADKFLRHHLTCHGVVRGVSKTLTPMITRSVLQTVAANVFPSIWEHSKSLHNVETEDNHVHQIIKESCRLYVKMILHHHERLLCDRFINKDQGTLRHKLTKTVLFLHQ